MLNEILFVLAAFVLAFVGGGIGGFVAELLRGRSVLVRMESLENSIRGSSSRAKQADKAERMQMAMFEAMTAFKAGKKPEEILKEVGGKYPDVALDMGKKILQEGL